MGAGLRLRLIQRAETGAETATAFAAEFILKLKLKPRIGLR